MFKACPRCASWSRAALLACALAAPAAAAAPDEGLGDCAFRQEARAYVTRLRERMLALWQLPVSTPPGATVTLRFRIGAAGQLLEASVVEGDDDLRASALVALRASSPFGAITSRTECLVGDPLVATFRNPGQRQRLSPPR